MDSEFPNRRLSTAVTLSVLVGLLVVGAVVGMQALFAPIGDNTDITLSPTCTPTLVEAGRRIRTEDVTISVFNASDRSGLAGDTLDKLARRGFLVGEVGNAPDDADVAVVQVWTTTEDDAAARLVARQFGRGTVVKQAEDLGTGIDVVVGQRFKGLVAGAPRSIKSNETEEVCAS